MIGKNSASPGRRKVIVSLASAFLAIIPGCQAIFDDSPSGEAALTIKNSSKLPQEVEMVVLDAPRPIEGPLLTANLDGGESKKFTGFFRSAKGRYKLKATLNETQSETLVFNLPERNNSKRMLVEVKNSLEIEFTTTDR